jgi:diguanylate cyclase (GGDEF)-like protein
MGGDEFAVLLAGADRRASETVIQRVREELGGQVQVSCGLAASPEDGSEIGELYRRADAGLYEAKRARPDVPIVPQLRSVGGPEGS